MADKPPELNTLDRFTKTSRLVLEEHGHCEVPAGCGGVVLRWWNPDQAAPLRIWLYTPGEVEQFLIDGQVPGSSRPLVKFGRHVFAIKLAGLPSASGLLSFAAMFETQGDRVRRTQGDEPLARIHSQANGTWRASTTTPSDDWTSIDYDDSTWTALVDGSFKAPDRKSPGFYRFGQVKAKGGAPLGLPIIGRGWTSWFFGNRPTKVAAIWIRKSFELSQDRIKT